MLRLAACSVGLWLAGVVAARAPGNALHVLEVSGGWEHGVSADSSAPRAAPEGWQPVRLPHVHAAPSPLGLYRAAFAVPGAWAGARVCLILRPIGGAARVWLNGQFLGARAPSALDIRLDASAAVRPGTANRLLVALSGAGGAGLAACWLEATGALSIGRLTPSPCCMPQGAVLDFAPEVSNGTRERFEGRLELTLEAAADGIAGGAALPRVWRRSSDVRADPGRSANVALSLEMDAPRLWRFDDPFLYRLTAELRSRENQPLRTASRPLGIRDIAMGQGRLFANGEWVRLAAVALAAPGATLLCTQPGQAQALIQRLGRPAPLEELLGYCDQAGIVALLDAPACPPDTPGCGETLEALAAEAALHPCVWGWVLRGGPETASVALARLRELMPRTPIGRTMPCTEAEAKGCDFLLSRFETRPGREDDDAYGRRLDDLLRAAAGKALIVVDSLAEANDKGRIEASFAHRLREAERRAQIAVLAFEFSTSAPGGAAAEGAPLVLAETRLSPFSLKAPRHEVRADRAAFVVKSRFEVQLASPVAQRLPCYGLLGCRVAWQASQGEALISAGVVPLTNSYPRGIEGGAQPGRGEAEWRTDGPGDIAFSAELLSPSGRVLARHEGQLSLKARDGKAELSVPSSAFVGPIQGQNP